MVEERFGTRRELIRDRRVGMPGITGCLGKNRRHDGLERTKTAVERRLAIGRETVRRRGKRRRRRRPRQWWWPRRWWWWPRRKRWQTVNKVLILLNM